MIEDGHNGLLFNVGDTEAMSAAAVDLFRNENRLQAMAKAARKTAQDRFCASRVIPIYEDYYDRVIARTASSTR